MSTTSETHTGEENVGNETPNIDVEEKLQSDKISNASNDDVSSTENQTIKCVSISNENLQSDDENKLSTNESKTVTPTKVMTTEEEKQIIEDKTSAKEMAANAANNQPIEIESTNVEKEKSVVEETTVNAKNDQVVEEKLIDDNNQSNEKTSIKTNNTSKNDEQTADSNVENYGQKNKPENEKLPDEKSKNEANFETSTTNDITNKPLDKQLVEEENPTTDADSAIEDDQNVALDDSNADASG